MKKIRIMEPKTTPCSIFELIDIARNRSLTYLEDWAIKSLKAHPFNLGTKQYFEIEQNVRQELLYHLEGWDYYVSDNILRSECNKYKHYKHKIEKIPADFGR